MSLLELVSQSSTISDHLRSSDDEARDYQDKSISGAYEEEADEITESLVMQEDKRRELSRRQQRLPPIAPKDFPHQGLLPIVWCLKRSRFVIIANAQALQQIGHHMNESSIVPNPSVVLHTMR